jgi:EAL and modified HD-GYP domain-containing signal transduction protein
MELEQNNQIFVGRQPIFNREQKVVAYELLYRSNGVAHHAEFSDGDRATSEVIINSVLDMGLESIVGKRTAFFNLTSSFIRGDHPLPLDNTQVVLEILEDVVPDEQLIAGMRELARQKYIIALDDFVYREELVPLLEIAHIVKLDVMGVSREALEQRVAQLKPYKLKLLAEKVETHEEFELCKALGFDYFQGYFLCRPHIVEGKSLPANRLVIMRMLAALQKPDIDMEEMEQLIIQDVSLTYRLLRYINSAAFALPNKIDSVHRALLMIGTKVIKNWVSLLLMSRIDDKPMELMRTALIRARMCELLAELAGLRSEREQYFTCGLFSVLDAMMDRPLAELLNELPLSDSLKLALTDKQGRPGEVLQQVLSYEKGAWEALVQTGTSTHDYRQCYLSAVIWADDSMAALQEPKQ